MPVDSLIIQQHAAYAVLAQCQPITWQDGSSIRLHPVRVSGRDERQLRAVQYDSLLWLVIHTSDLAPGLDADIRALPWSDTDGLVLHAVRLHYRNADELRARAVTRFKAGWAMLPGSAPRLHSVRAGRAMEAACWRRSGSMAQGVAA